MRVKKERHTKRFAQSFDSGINSLQNKKDEHSLLTISDAISFYIKFSSKFPKIPQFLKIPIFNCHFHSQNMEPRDADEGLISKMRRELERMEAVNRELGRRIFVETPRARADIEQLEADLSSERLISADLRRELALAVGRSARLAQMLERNANAQKAQTANYEAKLAELRDQIKRLNSLLMSKTKSRSIGPTSVRFPATVRVPTPSIQRRTQSGGAQSLPDWDILPPVIRGTLRKGEQQQQQQQQMHPSSLGIDGGPTSERRRKDCAIHRQKLLQQHTTVAERNNVIV